MLGDFVDEILAQRLRGPAPDGHAVTLLGACAHTDKPSADDLRAREAADVAAAVRTAVSQRWQVAAEPHAPDGDCWRDVRLGDIAVLLPARTSLPHLEDALDAAGIPYRAEASSLVYRSPRGPRPAHRRPGSR